MSVRSAAPAIQDVLIEKIVDFQEVSEGQGASFVGKWWTEAMGFDSLTTSMGGRSVALPSRMAH
jgi:hypothetical protein